MAIITETEEDRIEKVQGSADVLEGEKERVGVTIRQLGTVVLGLVRVVLNFFSHVFLNFSISFNFVQFPFFW